MGGHEVLAAQARLPRDSSPGCLSTCPGAIVTADNRSSHCLLRVQNLCLSALTIQVKNKFRPVRKNARNLPGTVRSWNRARRTGSAAVIPPPPDRKQRSSRSRGRSRSSGSRGNVARSRSRNINQDRHLHDQDAAMREYEQQVYRDHARLARADRARQRLIARADGYDE